ncbi:uncharacterized protein LOC109809790 isoform X1 [Cajanus cajan]|uniref:uncharacterized protein LOC109809790 isoform X1 n=1 Tax=Cajanus cajan TaxID=3821 RepID=UPI0010FAE3D1|nr:uncharacterized protein LOC109809790 isoform X1 [Cajanus cajan]XP_029129483.1 uncharacterized protein LOC109809790 isoform X1 [Cajanus cajan]
MESQDDVDQVLKHELIHAFDDCRAANLDWTKCAHHACSEIRAGHLSGDCHFKRELFKLASLKIRGHEQFSGKLVLLKMLEVLSPSMVKNPRLVVMVLNLVVICSNMLVPKPVSAAEDGKNSRVDFNPKVGAGSIAMVVAVSDINDDAGGNQASGADTNPDGLHKNSVSVQKIPAVIGSDGNLDSGSATEHGVADKVAVNVPVVESVVQSVEGQPIDQGPAGGVSNIGLAAKPKYWSLADSDLESDEDGLDPFLNQNQHL